MADTPTMPSVTHTRHNDTTRRRRGRYWQTLVWIGVVTVSKLGLFFFLLACADRFGSWGHVLFSPLYVCSPLDLLHPCVYTWDVGNFIA